MALLQSLGANAVVDPERPRAESILALMRRDLPPLPCYIGPALLPKGGKLLLGGEAKIGKTFLCMELCRALATGGRLYHSPTYPAAEKSRALLVDQEVGLAGLRERAINMLTDENAQDLDDNFYYVSKWPGLHLDKKDGLKALDQLCEDVRPNVLVLDPASRLLEGEDNDNACVRRFFENIDHLIKKYADEQLSVVVAHHFRKPPLDDLDLDDEERYNPYNFRGAGEWPGAPDTIQTIVRPARLADEKDWLLGTQYETRHGARGKRLYLKVAPTSPRAVAEITEGEAHSILDQLRDQREEAEEAKKARKRSKRKPSGSGGYEEKREYGMGLR